MRFKRERPQNLEPQSSEIEKTAQEIESNLIELFSRVRGFFPGDKIEIIKKLSNEQLTALINHLNGVKKNVEELLNKLFSNLKEIILNERGEIKIKHVIFFFLGLFAASTGFFSQVVETAADISEFIQKLLMGFPFISYPLIDLILLGIFLPIRIVTNSYFQRFIQTIIQSHQILDLSSIQNSAERRSLEDARDSLIRDVIITIVFILALPIVDQILESFSEGVLKGITEFLRSAVPQTGIAQHPFARFFYNFTQVLEKLNSILSHLISKIPERPF